MTEHTSLTDAEVTGSSKSNFIDKKVRIFLKSLNLLNCEVQSNLEINDKSCICIGR